MVGEVCIGGNTTIFNMLYIGSPCNLGGKPGYNYKFAWFRKSQLSLRMEERAADGHRYAAAPLILHETFTAQTPVLVGACAGDVLLFSQVSFFDESGVSPFFWPLFIRILHGLTARIPGFHPGGPGSTPGVGKQNSFLQFLVVHILLVCKMSSFLISPVCIEFSI